MLALEKSSSEENGLQTAILLINTGTPDAPTATAVRPYLKEFLSDPRVVDVPRLAWWFVLNAFILPTRPQKSAQKYASIWTVEGSPLRIHSERQASLLRGFLGEAGKFPRVALAMRYGNPSIAQTLDALAEQSCRRLLVVPLFPQYSQATSASAVDAVFAWAKSTRNQPEIRTIRSFPNFPPYIDALANQVKAHWQKNGRPSRSDASYKLLMSFHGTPKSYFEKGDTYYNECLATAQKLAQALDLPPSHWEVCFQSRVGRQAWLKPYTDIRLATLADEGIARVDIICPGFVADCLETLEEIAKEGKSIFLNSGKKRRETQGKTFHYIPCLNENEAWIDALAALCSRHLEGWDTDLTA